MQKLINKYSVEKYRDGVNKYLVLILLLVIPLYLKFPLVSIPGTFVAVRLEDFVMFFVFLLWFLFNVDFLKGIFKNKLLRLVILFWLAGAVSLASAIFITKTVQWHIGVFHWLRRVQYMLPLFVGVTAAGKRNVSFFVKVIALVVLLLFVYGLGQKYLYWPIITTQNFEYSKGVALRYVAGAHLPSTFAGHYDLASYLVLVFPVLIGLLVSIKTRLGKGVLLMVSGSGFWLLVSSISRISFVSYILGASLVLIFLKKKMFIPILVLVSIGLALTSPDLMGRYRRVIDVFVDKIVSTADISVHAAGGILGVVMEDRSSSIRFNVEWPRAVRALAKNPLVGTGYSSISLATDNDYLRMLGETGVLGFFAFWALILRIIAKLLEAVSWRGRGIERVFVLGITAGVFGVLVNALFIDVFEASKFATAFWLMVGLAVGTVNRYKPKVL